MPSPALKGRKAVADYALVECPKLDVILVPGGIGTRQQVSNGVVLEWLQRRSGEAEVVTSVCTGAALLAKAGLLDGRNATSNKAAFRLGRRAGTGRALGPAGALGRGWPLRHLIRRLRRDRHDARRHRPSRGPRYGRTDRRTHGVRLASGSRMGSLREGPRARTDRRGEACTAKSHDRPRPRWHSLAHRRRRDSAVLRWARFLLGKLSSMTRVRFRPSWRYGARVLLCATLTACGGSLATSATTTDEAPEASSAGAAADPCTCPPGSAPTTVVAGQTGLTDIKTDGTYIYFARSDGTIAKVSVCGGPVTVLATIASDGGTLAPSLAISSDTVFFSSGVQPVYSLIGQPNMPISVLASVPKKGGAVMDLASAVFPSLAATEHFLYWADLVGTIERLPIGLQGPVQHVGGQYQLMSALAADDTSAYWVDGQWNLNRQVVGGGGPVVLAFAVGASSIAVDTTSVYWTSNSLLQAPTPSQPEGPTSTSSYVGHVSIDGGGAGGLATGWVFLGMAVDGGNAYWLDSYAKAVESVPLNGGATVTLAANEPNLLGPAFPSLLPTLGPVIDSRAVYWATSDGSMRKVAKVSPSACPLSAGVEDAGVE